MSERRPTETVITQVLSTELSASEKGPAGRVKLSHNGKAHGVWKPDDFNRLRSGMWIKGQVTVTADGRFNNLESFEETVEPAAGSPERIVAQVTGAAGTYESAEEREARLRMQAMGSAQQAAARAMAVQQSLDINILRHYSRILYWDILAAGRGEPGPETSTEAPAASASGATARSPEPYDEEQDPKGKVTDWLAAYQGASTIPEVNQTNLAVPAALRNHPLLTAARNAAVKRITGK